MSEPFFKTIRIIRKINQPDSEQIDAVVEKINDFLDATKEVSIVSETNVDGDTLFVAIGGDGTTMRAANQAANVQGNVLGINCGNLGFLSEFTANDVVQLLTDLHKNKSGVFKREKRQVLVGNPHTSIDKAIAVNDFYVTATDKTCISYELVVDGEVVSTQRADGVIVCSPTGSTAYGLAAGGGIIMPTCKVMEIIAVAPHALTNRPIIVPSDSDVIIRVESDQDVCLFADGQKVPFPLGDKCYELQVSTNQRKYFNFVKSSHRTHNFFNIIHNKLG